jgi:hypothetical protein
MRKRLLLAIVTMALCACGSSSSASTTGSSSPSPSPSPSEQHIAAVDACKLVTASEASAAAGKKLVNLQTLGAPVIPGACFYGAQGSSTGVFVYAQVYPDTATADAVTAQQFQVALAAQLGQGATSGKEVDGIGDKAFEFTGEGNAGKGVAIIVFKENVVFIVAVDPGGTTATEGLARTAVGRLGS